MSKRFADFRVIHTRHTRWSKSGVWQRIFKALAADTDNEYAMINSTIGVRINIAQARKRGGRGPAIGRSRGGLSTKIHATVDALGNPTGFHLTLGQAYDLEDPDALLPDTPAATIIADKTYDAQERVIDPLHDAGKIAVIPPKRSRTQLREYDKHLYRAGHLIEQFFNKLKQYRGIATRYDQTARNFLGAIHLSASVVCLD